MLSSESRLSPEEATLIGVGSINSGSGSGSGLWLYKSAWKIGMTAISESCNSSRAMFEKIRHECVRKKKPKGGLGYKIIVINRALVADIEVGVSRRSDQFIVLYVPKEPAGVTRSLAKWIGRQGYDISCHASHEWGTV
jgi:hypothetical protein